MRFFILMVSLTHNISSISSYLKILGLQTTRIPSISSVKKRFREKALACHPDKVGDGSTAAFQELSDACVKVLEFLAELPSYNETAANLEEEMLLQLFRSKNRGQDMPVGDLLQHLQGGFGGGYYRSNRDNNYRNY